jgi:hypothetical protein
MGPASPPQLIAETDTLYTPFQVRLASFIGGPGAAIYTLHWNFRRLKKFREARVTLFCGGALVVVMLVGIPFLPAKFPNTVIPLAYSISSGSVAASKQLSKEAIVASGKFVRSSGWNVAAVCFISLLSLSVIMIAVWFVMDHFGIINLGE